MSSLLKWLITLACDDCIFYCYKLYAPSVGVKEILGLLVVALLVYAMLVLAIGKPFLPNNGHMWGLCLVWFCGHIGAWLATKVTALALEDLV